MAVDESLKPLFRRFRSDLCDPVPEDESDVPFTDCLWPDTDVVDYLDDAQYETARRTLAVFDIFDLPIVADKATYSVPRYILRVRRAKFTSDGRDLTIVNNNDRGTTATFSDDYGVWREQILSETATGASCVLTFDERQNQLRLAPMQSTVDTLRLYVYRTPKERIENVNSTLELSDQKFERAMLLYMKKRAYEKDDADVRDENKSAKYFTEFLDEVGRLKQEATLKHRRVGVTRYGGL